MRQWEAWWHWLSGADSCACLSLQATHPQLSITHCGAGQPGPSVHPHPGKLGPGQVSRGRGDKSQNPRQTYTPLAAVHCTDTWSLLSHRWRKRHMGRYHHGHLFIVPGTSDKHQSIVVISATALCHHHHQWHSYPQLLPGTIFLTPVVEKHHQDARRKTTGTSFFHLGQDTVAGLWPTQGCLQCVICKGHWELNDLEQRDRDHVLRRMRSAAFVYSYDDYLKSSVTQELRLMDTKAVPGCNV